MVAIMKMKHRPMAVVLAGLLLSLCSIAQAGYSDNGDGTVSDTSTKLMWQKCTAPTAGTSCVTPLPELYIWDDALAYCNGLTLGGHGDWRLPNVKELQSLLDVNKTTAPNINTGYFPDTQMNYYWSSTTSAGTQDYAWYVNFNLVSYQFVITSGLNKKGTNFVRCVR